MVSYKELLSFLWRFIKVQKWTFFFIFLIDSFTWPLDALLWPYILHLAIDIFTRFEENRLAVWGALSIPIASGLGLAFFTVPGRQAAARLLRRVDRFDRMDRCRRSFPARSGRSPHFSAGA